MGEGCGGVDGEGTGEGGGGGGVVEGEGMGMGMGRWIDGCWSLCACAWHWKGRREVSGVVDVGVGVVGNKLRCLLSGDLSLGLYSRMRMRMRMRSRKVGRTCNGGRSKSTPESCG